MRASRNQALSINHKQGHRTSYVWLSEKQNRWLTSFAVLYNIKRSMKITNRVTKGILGKYDAREEIKKTQEGHHSKGLRYSIFRGINTKRVGISIQELADGSSL